MGPIHHWFKSLSLLWIKNLQKCLPGLRWSQSRRWRGRSICRPSAASQHPWRWGCGFPRTAWADTRHAHLHESETKTRQTPGHESPARISSSAEKQQQKGENFTRKLAPMRRDPVPEMVCTVMFCTERGREGEGRGGLGFKYCHFRFQLHLIWTTQQFNLPFRSLRLHSRHREPAERRLCWTPPDPRWAGTPYPAVWLQSGLLPVRTVRKPTGVRH